MTAREPTLSMLMLAAILALSACPESSEPDRPTYIITCPDMETYRSVLAMPNEGMLETIDIDGRRVVVPGSCVAVQGEPMDADAWRSLRWGS